MGLPFLTAIAPIAGAAISAFGANRAANAQVKATDAARGDQREGVNRADGILTDGATAGMDMLQRGYRTSRNALNRGYGDARDMILDAYQTQEGIFNPMMQQGDQARAAFNFNLGIGDRPDGYDGFRAAPGYEFQRNEGLRAIEGGAAARGGLYSGATMKDAMRFGTGLADQSFNTYMSQLGDAAQVGERAGYGLADAAGATGNALGQMDAMRGMQLADMRTAYGNNRANMTVGTATNRGQVWNSLGNNLSQLALNAGDARAAGTVGLTNALNDGIGNWMGLEIFKKYAPKPENKP